MVALTQEQHYDVGNLLSDDKEITTLKIKKQLLGKEKTEVDNILGSMNEQIKNIVLEKDMAKELTSKGITVSSDVYIEKQKIIRNLIGYLHRVTKARIYKRQEEESIRAKLTELNKNIKKRNCEITKEYLKSCTNCETKPEEHTLGNQ